MENERFNRQNSRPNDAAERNNNELNRGNQETTNTLHSAVTASFGSQTGVKSPYSRQVKDGTSLSEKADNETYSSGYVYVRTGSKSSLTSQTKRKSLLQQSLDDINICSCNFPSSKDTTQSFSNGYIDVRTGSDRSLTSQTKRKSLLFRRHSLDDIYTGSPAFSSSFVSLSYSKADSNSYADVNSVSHSLLPAESNVYESIGSIRSIDSTPHDNVNPAGESNDRRGCNKKHMTLVIVLLVTLIVTSVGVDIWKILETNDGLHKSPKELTASQKTVQSDETVAISPGLPLQRRNYSTSDSIDDWFDEFHRKLKAEFKPLCFPEGKMWMLNSTIRSKLFDVSLPGTIDICDAYPPCTCISPWNRVCLQCHTLPQPESFFFTNCYPTLVT